jgi:GNAT superfamily N-acetyltransferase
MLIRRAGIFDFKTPDLGELWCEMVVEELGNRANPDRHAWEANIMHEMFNNKYFVMLIALEDDKPVGFIMGHGFYEPADSRIHGISQHIYVRPEFRGKRASMSLYHELAKTMKAMCVEIMGLCCVPEKTAFWGRKGFTPVQTLFEKEIINA